MPPEGGGSLGALEGGDVLAGVTRGSHGRRRCPVGAEREGASVPQRAALLLLPLRQPQCRGKGRYCIGASKGTRLVAADEGALMNVGKMVFWEGYQD